MSKVLTVHQTDLFRPHNDPDDHYDLACQFALYKKGYIDLKNVIVDFPPHYFGSPDIEGINQLAYLTKTSTVITVGTDNNELSQADIYLKKLLEEVTEKVVIHIVGSCADIAKFGKNNTKLIEDKVQAIYLNAGSSNNGKNPEYNVSINADSFSSIFTLPTKIFWMPCIANGDEFLQRDNHSTRFRFLHKDILPFLSNRMQNYFIYAIRDYYSPDWIRVLDSEVNIVDKWRIGEDFKDCYCTAGFFYAAGLTVLKDGSLEKINQRPNDELIKFNPIKIISNNNGKVEWEDTKSSNVYIYTITDMDIYDKAMTKALRTCIKWIDEE